jgi:hypothetical protein
MSEGCQQRKWGFIRSDGGAQHETGQYMNPAFAACTLSTSSKLVGLLDRRIGGRGAR